MDNGWWMMSAFLLLCVFYCVYMLAWECVAVCMWVRGFWFLCICMRACMWLCVCVCFESYVLSICTDNQPANHSSTSIVKPSCMSSYLSACFSVCLLKRYISLQHPRRFQEVLSVGCHSMSHYFSHMSTKPAIKYGCSYSLLVHPEPQCQRFCLLAPTYVACISP